MNAGERDELLIQLKLVELRDTGQILPSLGRIESVKLMTEYRNLPTPTDIAILQEISETDLAQLAVEVGIHKAGAFLKADVVINGIGVSLKSLRKGPPAIVNHTSRPGFERAADYCGVNINDLDVLIADYWRLRLAGTITEDTRNTDSYSPFANHKSILKPYLNYFLFKGTGSKLSDLPSEYILSFSDPLNIATWRLFNQSEAVDDIWGGLVFSLRSKKGMPPGYPNVTARYSDVLPSIRMWTREIAGDYRGALHIRSTR